MSWLISPCDRLRRLIVAALVWINRYGSMYVYVCVSERDVDWMDPLRSNVCGCSGAMAGTPFDIDRELLRRGPSMIVHSNVASPICVKFHDDKRF